MANSIVRLPVDYFPDFNVGRPLFNAKVFIGEPDLDPEVEANRKTVTVRQEDGTEVPVLAAGQPLRTGTGGALTFNGSPVQVLVDGNYSIKVLDSQDNQEYYFDNVFDGAPLTISDIGVSKATIADAKADNSLAALIGTDGYVTVKEYATGKGVIDANYDVVAAATGTDDGFEYHDSDTAGLFQLRLRLDTKTNAIHAGCVGDDSTDNATAIANYMAHVRSTAGKAYFPANQDGSATVYQHSNTIYYGASGVVIEGESQNVFLKYTGVGTQLQANSSSGVGTSRERCGIKNISLTSSTGVRCIDWTGFTYGSFHDFEIAYTAASAILLYATGNNGVGPYFNVFDRFSLFGTTDRTQIGMQLNQDASGNLADGPNANIITNIKRGASLARLIDLKAGTGNLFTNISGESISDAMIALNDLASVDSGTATSTTQNTLVNSGESWSVTPGDATNYTNDAVKVTNGSYSGIVRQITSNTGTVLSLDKPWPDTMGTPTYEIYEGKAVRNKFINIRQEGLSSDNPDGIRVFPGARGNELDHMEIGSLGSGSAVDDQSGDPSNLIKQGELTVQTFVSENPGASANVELVPRSSTLGGFRAGSNMVLEWVDVKSPNFVAGTATAVVTVDHGGSSTGGGTYSIAATINDTNTNSAFAANLNKVAISSENAGIFVNLTTNSNVNAASDFIVTVGIRIFP